MARDEKMQAKIDRQQLRIARDRIAELEQDAERCYDRVKSLEMELERTESERDQWRTEAIHWSNVGRGLGGES